MKKQRKHYRPAEKVAILMRHLVEGVPISDLCDERGLQPTVFYRWQKEFFENGAAAFQERGRTNHQAEQERIAYLEKKIQTKDEVLAELMAEHVALKKKSWGTLTGVWVPHDTRDQIVDFVRRWSEKTEISAGLFIGWLDITASKFYGWRERYGKISEHNGWVRRDFWLEDWEKQAVIAFHLKNPLEGYRRLTFMMLDAGRTEKQAWEVRAAIARRMQECRLELHPEKTKIVYCKDDDRRERYAQEKFDFLGYTFRPRSSKSRKGKYFINFSPAISEKASKAIRSEIRDWKLHLCSDKSLEDLSRMFNPIIRGWFQYYGRFYRSGLYPLRSYLNRVLARWATRKYKKLRHHFRRAEQWLLRISRRDPRLFAHWQLGAQRGSAVGAV